MLTLSGAKVVPYDAEDLWDLLMDPAVIQRCLPGCDRLNEVGEGKFDVVLRFRVGLLSSRFRGGVELLEREPASGYRMKVEAKGSSGFVRGSTRVQLHPVGVGEKTEVKYESRTEFGGLLASVGGRVLDEAGRRFADSFFEQLAKS